MLDERGVHVFQWRNEDVAQADDLLPVIIFPLLLTISTTYILMLQVFQ